MTESLILIRNSFNLYTTYTHLLLFHIQQKRAQYQCFWKTAPQARRGSSNSSRSFTSVTSIITAVPAGMIHPHTPSSPHARTSKEPLCLQAHRWWLSPASSLCLPSALQRPTDPFLSEGCFISKHNIHLKYPSFHY